MEYFSYETLKDIAKSLMKDNPKLPKIKLSSSKKELIKYVKKNQISNDYNKYTPISLTGTDLSYIKTNKGYHFEKIKISAVDNDVQTQAIQLIKQAITELVKTDKTVQNGKIQIDLSTDEGYISTSLKEIRKLTKNDFQIEFKETGRSIQEISTADLSFSIYPFKEGGNGGVNGVITNQDITSKTSIVKIHNPNDQMCAVRAALVCLFKELYKSNKVTKDKYAKMRRNEKFKLQRDLATDICKSLNHDTNKPWNFSELNLLATKLQGQFKEKIIIIVVNGQSHKLYETDPYNTEQDVIRLYLLYTPSFKIKDYETTDHYHAVVNIQGLRKGCYFCKPCHVYYKNKNSHNCYRQTCKTCNELLHNIGPTCNKCKKRICDNCVEHVCYNVKYPEKQLKENETKCENCNQVTTNVENHQCYEKQCSCCKQLIADIEQHHCYVQQSKLKESIERLCVFDFECSQDNDQLLHVPVLIIAKDIEDEYTFYDLNSFCEWMFSRKFKCTYIAHNGRGYDTHFVLNWLITKGIKPNVVMQTSKILQLTYRNVRIIDSLSHIQIPLRAISKSFGITETKKGYFPYKMISRKNNGYVGKWPSKETYGENTSEFNEWYDRQVELTNNVWDYEKELYEYCLSDVKVLYEACIKFQELFGKVTGSDPFAYITSASHCFNIFTSLYMPENSIPIIPDEFGKKYTTSKKEQQWIKYIELTWNIKIKRQARMLKYTVDGYCKDNSTVYQFHGCYWHGCKKCFPTGTNEFNKKPFAVLRKTTETIEAEITKHYKLKTIWEHDFDNLLRILDKETLKSLEVKESDLPLKPKDAMFGGRTETFIAYADNIEADYYDFTSLYPYVQSNCYYPSGKCNVIYTPKEWDPNWFGFAKISIRAPKDLLFPVLPVKRVIDGQSKLLFDLNDKVGTWCTNEINLALSKGYKIEKIYEVWHYSKKRLDIFSEYVKVFLKIKQEASDYPSWVSNETDKDKYINDYHERQGILLDKTKIEKNPGLRFIAKLCLNSLWGKFGQNLDVDNIVYVNDDVDYFNKLASSKIKRCKELTDEMAVITMGSDQKSNYRTSMCVAAFTTAHARIKLYNLIDQIHTSGGIVYYCDTDSVIFSGSNEIQTGDLLGELTSELGDNEKIVKFASTGAKSYGYLTNQTDKAKIKMKGLPRKCFNFDELYKLAKKEINKIVDQPTMVFKKDDYHNIYTVNGLKEVNNTLDKRLFFPDGNSYPFGFDVCNYGKED